MILGYLKDQPNQTAYSLSKSFELPLIAVQKILKECESEMEIKITETLENGRKKNLVRLFEPGDFTHTDFNINTIMLPRNKRNAIRALEKGHRINIHHSNDRMVQLAPKMILEQINLDATQRTVERFEFSVSELSNSVTQVIDNIPLEI